MRYKRFEDLPVWRDALSLAKLVIELARSGIFKSISGFRDQIERAVVSVSNNIAEGFERGTNGELLTFLYIAKGSVAEVRSMLWLFEEIQPDCDEDISSSLRSPRGLSESISRQLGAWIESVKSSGYEGNRSVTPALREVNEQRARAEDFDNYLRDLQEQAKRNREAKQGSPESTPNRSQLLDDA